MARSLHIAARFLLVGAGMLVLLAVAVLLVLGPEPGPAANLKAPDSLQRTWIGLAVVATAIFGLLITSWRLPQAKPSSVATETAQS